MTAALRFATFHRRRIARLSMVQIQGCYHLQHQAREHWIPVDPVGNLLFLCLLKLFSARHNRR